MLGAGQVTTLGHRTRFDTHDPSGHSSDELGHADCVGVMQAAEVRRHELSGHLTGMLTGHTVSEGQLAKLSAQAPELQAYGSAEEQETTLFGLHSEADDTQAP